MVINTFSHRNTLTEKEGIIRMWNRNAQDATNAHNTRDSHWKSELNTRDPHWKCELNTRDPHWKSELSDLKTEQLDHGHNPHRFHSCLVVRFIPTPTGRKQKEGKENKNKYLHAYSGTLHRGPPLLRYQAPSKTADSETIPLAYHWWELPQVSFLSWKSFVMTKHVFCRDKSHDKHTSVVTKDVDCHDKTFIAMKMILVAAPTNDTYLTMYLWWSYVPCLYPHARW